MKRLVAVTLGAVVGATTALASLSLAHADTLVSRERAATIRARVLELANEARSKSRRCGNDLFPAAAPLVESKTLQQAAQRHADDMARRKYFDHRGKDGSLPRDRVLGAGYSFRLTGENIAFAPVSAEEVMQGWLASPGHCANLMDARFTELGVGVATGRERGHVYWVQEFGQPLTGG